MDDRDDTDDGARKRTAGKEERTSPGLPTPGFPGRHLRPIPRPAPAVPTRLDQLPPELDVTPVEPAVARRRERERQQTLTGLGPDEPPRSLSPVPAERSPLPAPAPLPRPSLAVAAASLSLPRLLAIIAASATGIAGVVTALGGAAAQIIVALKPSREFSELDRRVHAVEERAAADWGLTDETKTRRGEDDGIRKEVTALRGDVDALKTSTPQIHGLVPTPKKK